MKKHIVTVRTKNQIFTAWVPGRTDPDGKTRISKEAMQLILKRAGTNRGECIKIG